jgi:nitrite reductase (NO-forming)
VGASSGEVKSRRGRVVESHTIARLALRLAGLFAVVAVVWAGVVLIRGGSWWGPLHAFLAGTVLLAISGAAQMFTITWATAPPPSRGLAAFQRWAVAAGVIAVLFGITADTPLLVWLGAGAVILGLIALGTSIVGAIRRSLLRRFDLSARFYLTACASGVVGIFLGALLGTGALADRFFAARLVHSHLNLLGLVGLTIVGTLPTFLPTTAHHRAVSGREAIVAWWLVLGGVVVMTSALWAPPEMVGAANLAIAAAAAAVLAGILMRLWRKGIEKLPFVQVSIGVIWLIVWAIVDGIGILQSGTSPIFGGWAAAAVVAGVGQVLAGSLAYIVPVLLGPPLEPTSSILTRHRWIPLTLINGAGVGLAAGLGQVAAAAIGLWVVDILFRVTALARARTTLN